MVQDSHPCHGCRDEGTGEGRTRRRLGTIDRAKLAITTVAATVGMLIGVQISNAHVTVVPNQSPANAYELYTVRVPTEKPIPTIKVKLAFPEGVDVSRFAPAPGWKRDVEKDATGRITSVTWSGGSIASDELGVFMFQGKNGKGGSLTFKADQTYLDGSVVEWANAPADANPASVVILTDVPMAAAELTDAAAIGQVVAAILSLDAAGFHGLDTAIAGGEIPAGSIGKVNQATAITAAVKWPAELREDAHALAGNLKALSAAIAAGSASAAADPAKAVHDGAHDLSKKVYAWLGEMGGDHGVDAPHSH